MRSAPIISFEWRPSRGWRLARWTALATGAGCMAWSSIDPAAALALALLAGWLEWRQLRFERCWASSTWRLDGAGSWRWQRADEERGAATLAQATLLGPLLVLNLVRGTGRIDLPIWPDQLDATTRRRLRVRLGTLREGPIPAPR